MSGRPPIRGAWLAAAAWCVATAAGAAGPAAAAPAARVHVVTIAGMRYSPATLQARVGERIEWVNTDLVPHTVTARDGSFDSKSIPAGARWSWVPTRAASVAYACAYHPDMSASVTIR